ncbi:MAG: nucleotidyl transferase AbiEii/AbiGii toxin family protein [Candidatus Kerfeldbacteria bacterium]|nr:nucleotidyl transferase AbiEii/AbiGii toxin family protein [Candidatus Kerfeldbacteria bacterium]
MSEQILSILKNKLNTIASNAGIDAETRRNTLKEELQFFVLNFIYHHPEHKKWILYGGSALRIVHDLNRMSVDLDFEVAHHISESWLKELKKELENHFTNTYGAGSDFLTVKITTGRGLLLKFIVGEELSSGHPSKQMHIKIDLNNFVAPKTVIERRPISKDQLSFVIVTYNMSALMASKIAAIFLRGQRGVGDATYEEKGRDIYDLLWYMSKKVVPDFDYLAAKGINVNDPRGLFDRLTVQMNKVSDENLKQDLIPLFVDRTFIENWVTNWRESYFRLLESYEIHTVTELEKVGIQQDFRTDIYYFVYWYHSEEGKPVRIMFALSDYWIEYRGGNLLINIEKKVDSVTEFIGGGLSNKPSIMEKLKQYATLFYKKAERYLRKTNRVVLGDTIITKVIRMTTDKLNQKEQIVLNKSALLSCELDDLLK